MIKNLLIIGARGLGRTVHNYLQELEENNVDFRIKGFLDDKINALEGFYDYAPIISSVEDYNVSENDIFICSLGDLIYKKKYTEIILKKGGEFFTLIHPQARVMKDAQIGVGTIIAPWCTVGTGSVIGAHCLIQCFSVIAHDVKIGDWSRVDTHAVCTGGATIGENVTIHTGAILNQRVKVGDNVKVGAGCFVFKNIKPGKTVYGNPAKEL
jgi:sugar O-acyltransferase (sialic acid O-acetyltransferase NeuD family)